MELPQARQVILSVDITLELLAFRGLAIQEGKLVIAGPSRVRSFDSGIGEDDNVSIRSSGSGEAIEVDDIEAEGMDVDHPPLQALDHAPGCPAGRFNNHFLEQAQQQSARVAELEEHTAALEAEVTRLLGENSGTLEGDATALQERITALEQRNATLEDEARTGLPRLLTENHALRNHVTELEGSVTQLKVGLAEFQESAYAADHLRASLAEQTERAQQKAREVELLNRENTALSDEVAELEIQLRNASLSPPARSCNIPEHRRWRSSTPRETIPSPLRAFWTQSPGLDADPATCSFDHLSLKPLQVQRVVEDFRKSGDL